jgi:hypothetical protein
MKNKNCNTCGNWIKERCVISAMRICAYSLNIVPCGLDKTKLSKRLWKCRPQRRRKVAKRRQPEIVESNSPCAYCKFKFWNCSNVGCLYNGYSYFEGRKLSPVT